MNRSTLETLLGAVVLAIALYFGYYIYQSNSGVNSGGEYQLIANFSKIDGVKPGTDVRLSGIKVGSVRDVKLDPDTYLASIHISIDDQYKVPKDSVISVASEGLLGGHYVALEPGGEEEYLADGDTFSYTQAPTSLTDLLGKFIFSATNDTEKEKK